MSFGGRCTPELWAVALIRAFFCRLHYATHTLVELIWAWMNENQMNENSQHSFHTIAVLRGQEVQFWKGDLISRNKRSSVSRKYSRNHGTRPRYFWELKRVRPIRISSGLPNHDRWCSVRNDGFLKTPYWIRVSLSVRPSIIRAMWSLVPKPNQCPPTCERASNSTMAVIAAASSSLVGAFLQSGARNFKPRVSGDEIRHLPFMTSKNSFITSFVHI